jgi:hypothetical protein
MASKRGMKWGDDDDDYLPPREVHGPNADGIKTVIEYKFKIHPKAQKQDADMGIR